MPSKLQKIALAGFLALAAPSLAFAADKKEKSDKGITDAEDQHAAIGVKAEPVGKPCPHTDHPDAQWFPEAGFGFFLHWGLSSVLTEKNPAVRDLSWPMVVGAWKNKTFNDPKDRERIIRERDWNFDGKAPVITPNEYWAAAKSFNPQKYDPDKWIAAAKAAGFTYAVLTTKHHEGFALWPSEYGDFNTKNYMGGRDLVKPFVDACRKHGLKVGLYYSPPDWHFNREFENFMYYGTARLNPWLPELDADLNPRTTKKTAEERERQIEAFNAMEKGQIEELLTRYGKIDMLWFDGSIPAPKDKNAPRPTQERIRELQPGIVLSPRFFNRGDYITFEGPVLKTDKKPNGWSEWCTTWGSGWDYNAGGNYANGLILGNLARARSLDINMNLGIGPDKDGELNPKHLRDMAVVSGWMRTNRPAVVGARALPKGESADVPATASGSVRYLFACPEYKKKAEAYDRDMKPLADAVMTLKGLKSAPKSVTLLADGKSVENEYNDGTLTVRLPVARRTNLPDVVKVELAK